MLAVGASVTAAYGRASFHGTRIVKSQGFTWAARGTRCCGLGPVLSPQSNVPRLMSISTAKAGGSECFLLRGIAHAGINESVVFGIHFLATHLIGGPARVPEFTNLLLPETHFSRVCE